MEDAPTREALAAKTELVELAAKATAQQFRNRLEVNVIIGAYLEKRFRERFPLEYQQWLSEQPE